MAKRRTFKEKLNSYLYKHLWLKYTFEYATTLVVCFFSALIFAIGLKVFLAPGTISYYDSNSVQQSETLLTLVSGGASGIAQIISLACELIFGSGLAQYSYTIYSIAYVAVNIPIVILAFKGIGIRFGIFTMLNVLFVSLLVNVLNFDFLNELAFFINNEGGFLARALFAGLCTGISSAVAFKFEISAGGIDVVSYYFSIKKSTNVGKYGIIINSTVVIGYAILTAIKGTINPSSVTYADANLSSWTIAIGGVCFSIVYMFIVMLVVDLINVRNKKVQLQIITKKENLHSLLLANVPHGATIMNGKGAFSGEEKIVIYMVVSQFETKRVVSLIREIDPDSFINVTNLQQVYGRFFIKPVK